jgi:hypothetical protein
MTPFTLYNFAAQHLRRQPLLFRSVVEKVMVHGALRHALEQQRERERERGQEAVASLVMLGCILPILQHRRRSHAR